jgi:hypothetical protein
VEILKAKSVAKFAKRERIADASLKEAIDRAELGLVDADLGGGLIKQRVARQGRGRSGGYRFIVAYRTRLRSVFLYAFAKNERENITQDELSELREVGNNWINATAQTIAEALSDGQLQEVNDDDEEKATKSAQ